ncbi:MAG: hypothetical protein QM621_01245 [Aeromicrobium sp.]|uniref:hypothetical protein n=1 Tax=Aeromicrobium sp. TaxID=1871063 RepID=UPI0039E28C48
MKIRLLGAAAVLPLSALVACGGDATADFCDTMKEAEETFDAEEEVSDEDAPEKLDEAGEQLNKLKDAAPDEISDDMDLLVEYSEAYLDLARVQLEDGDEAAMEGLTKLSEDFDQEELEAASDSVTEFTEKECDIDSDFLS